MYVSFNKNGIVYKLESPLVNKSQYLDINYLNIMESLIYWLHVSKHQYSSWDIPCQVFNTFRFVYCKSLIWSNFIYIFNNGVEAWIKLHMYFSYYVFQSLLIFFWSLIFPVLWLNGIVPYRWTVSGHKLYFYGRFYDF